MREDRALPEGTLHQASWVPDADACERTAPPCPSLVLLDNSFFSGMSWPWEASGCLVPLYNLWGT